MDDMKQERAVDFPCIDLAGNEKSKPSAVIADCDRSTLYQDLHAPGYKSRREKTGTPMFVALELSYESPFERYNFSALPLLKKFRAVEQLPELHRAFPSDDGTFMTTFEAIVPLEQLRNECPDPDNINPTLTDPNVLLHDPCYDVQGIYWCLLWQLTCALPENCEPLDEPDGAFSTYAVNMLEHRIGVEEARQHYLTAPYGRATILHDRLKYFARFFADIATYLSIPWHIYVDRKDIELSPFHAHIAMRCLLLVQILALERADKGHDVLLNTRQPRIINTTRYLSMTAQLEPRHEGDLMTSRSPDCPTQPSTRASKKRTADAAGLDENAQPPKRARGTAEDTGRAEKHAPSKASKEKSDKPKVCRA